MTDIKELCPRMTQLWLELWEKMQIGGRRIKENILDWKTNMFEKSTPRMKNWKKKQNLKRKKKQTTKLLYSDKEKIHSEIKLIVY